MADPLITPAIIGANCVIGLLSGPVGNRADWAVVAGARRVASILGLGSPEQNHHIMRATQIAYVSAMRDMADACKEIALGKDAVSNAKALMALTKRPEFKDFRFDGEHFPLDETNAAIDRMFSGGIGAISGGSSEDENRAFGRAIVTDLAAWNVPLDEIQQKLFEEGVGEHAAWHLRFRIALGEALLRDEKAREIFTQERLGEIRLHGIVLIKQIAGLHDRFDEVDSSLALQTDLLNKILANQGDGSQASFELLRSLAAGYAEPLDAKNQDELKSYLFNKIGQWRDYRAQIESLEAQGNRDAILLAEARAATDRGDFAAADLLLAEAIETLDEKIDSLLISKSARLALRADNAELAGDYRAAIAFYDESAQILPASAKDERFMRRWSAAATEGRWSRRLGEREAAADAVRRWEALRAEIDPPNLETYARISVNLGLAYGQLAEIEGSLAFLQLAVDAQREALTASEEPELRGLVHSQLGSALWRLGRRDETIETLKESIAAYSEALKVITVDNNPDSWATVQHGICAASIELCVRSDDPNDARTAVEAAEAALTICTFEENPIYWSVAKQSLAIALTDLGRLEDSIEHYRAAAETLAQICEAPTLKDSPLSWAGVQDDLGNVLALIGEKTALKSDFDRAVDAHLSSLEVRQRNKLPLPWALTKENLGITLMRRAQTLNCCVSAQRAVAALEEAVDGLKGIDMGWNEAKANSGLEEARSLVAALCP